MSMLMSTQQTRAFDDILEAEKTLRLTTDETNRELRKLLTDIAVRLDGEHLEQIRRGNPNIPVQRPGPSRVLDAGRMEAFRLDDAARRPRRRCAGWMG